MRTRTIIFLLLLLACTTTPAEFNVGITAYNRGDYKTALREFEKGVAKGEPGSVTTLGIMYYSGKGVPQDYKKAYAYYNQAVELGDGTAAYNLALMYMYSAGVQQDYVTAWAWLSVARALSVTDTNTAFDQITKKMTSEQSENSQGLSTEWLLKHGMEPDPAQQPAGGHVNPVRPRRTPG